MLVSSILVEEQNLNKGSCIAADSVLMDFT